MTKRRDNWDTSDLELFHDEELGGARASALTDALRNDGVLRARLSAVQRADDRIRSALLRPRPEPRVNPKAIRSRVAKIAAVVAVAAGALLWFRYVGPVPSEPVVDGVPNVVPYRAVRVVFAVPINRADGRPRRPTGPGETGAAKRSAARKLIDRLDRALADGRVEETLELIASADVDGRRAAYRHVGDVLRSAQVAEALLARLEPSQQLEVCSVWAAEPTLRPVVFARLQQLAHEPSLAHELQSLVSKLSERPGLRSWLRGYDLTRPS